jgi:hypothetical protein
MYFSIDLILPAVLAQLLHHSEALTDLLGAAGNNGRNITMQEQTDQVHNVSGCLRTSQPHSQTVCTQLIHTIMLQKR